MLAEKSANDAFAAFQVPNHTHNGLDSPRVNDVDVISNNKLFTTIIATNDGTPNVLTISQGLSNPKRVDVTSIITNGSTRTVTTGSAELGLAYIVLPNGSPLDSTNNPTSIAQLYSSVTNTGTSLVHAGRDFVAVGFNSSDAEVVKLQVSAFTETSVTFSAPLLETGWTITAFITIS